MSRPPHVRGLFRTLALAAAVVCTAVPTAAVGQSPAAGTDPHGQARLDSLLRRGRRDGGRKIPADSLRALLTAQLPNPFALLLSDAGRLHLSKAQVDGISSLGVKFTSGAIIEWTPVANDLAALPDRYDIGRAWNRAQSAENAMIARLRRDGSAAKAILTPAQLASLAPSLRALLDAGCGSSGSLPGR